MDGKVRYFKKTNEIAQEKYRIEFPNDWRKIEVVREVMRTDSAVFPDGQCVKTSLLAAAQLSNATIVNGGFNSKKRYCGGSWTVKCDHTWIVDKANGFLIDITAGQFPELDKVSPPNQMLFFDFRSGNPKGNVDWRDMWFPKPLKDLGYDTIPIRDDER